jgi:hypothetical protein
MGNATVCTSAVCSDDDCCLNEPLLPVSEGPAAAAIAGEQAEDSVAGAAAVANDDNATEGDTAIEGAAEVQAPPHSSRAGNADGGGSETAAATCGLSGIVCPVGSSAVPVARVCSGDTCTVQDCCQVRVGRREGEPREGEDRTGQDRGVLHAIVLHLGSHCTQEALTCANVCMMESHACDPFGSGTDPCKTD